MASGENLVIRLHPLTYVYEWVSERYKTPENQMTVRKLQMFGFSSPGSSEILKMSLRLLSSYQVIHLD